MSLIPFHKLYIHVAGSHCTHNKATNVTTETLKVKVGNHSITF